MIFKLFLSNNAAAFLEKIPEDNKHRIIRKLKQLEINPFDLPYKKIRGRQNTYRIRIGVFRIIYSVHENEIRVLKIGRREGIYK